VVPNGRPVNPVGGLAGFRKNCRWKAARIRSALCTFDLAASELFGRTAATAVRGTALNKNRPSLSGLGRCEIRFIALSPENEGWDH
jgi:hypothetical protein